MNECDWRYCTPGIPDSLFLRGKTPMTKEEVRVLTLSKLRLTPGSRILEVGAGSGSITVECARLAARGQVYAVERDQQALELVQANLARFGVSNVSLLAGEAPACLLDLPVLDGVVIGGSGGKLKEIIAAVQPLLKPGARVVINAVLLETVQAALAALQAWEMEEVGLLSVNIARGRLLGGGMALQPLDPVFIIWGGKAQQGVTEK